MPCNYMVTSKGDKEVKIMTTGFKKHISEMLCITAEGLK